MRSDADISDSKFLRGHITINNETIEFVGLVEPVDSSKMIYTVLFGGMHDKERNRILEYIFSIYRE
ncbi:MAG: hypothetical protein A2176_09085 [Spirochaetes bacterium RBG_13_51_14]|nr:MAG: hypothetical protein A2176_09085 [Spirochaetes bacterium RBG_13_51_14]